VSYFVGEIVPLDQRTGHVEALCLDGHGGELLFFYFKFVKLDFCVDHGANSISFTCF